MSLKKLALEMVNESIDEGDNLLFHKLIAKVFKDNYGIYKNQIKNGCPNRIIKIIRDENLLTELLYSMEETVNNQPLEKAEYLWSVDEKMLVHITTFCSNTTVRIGYLEDYGGVAFDISDKLLVYSEIRSIEVDEDSYQKNEINLLTLSFDQLTLSPFSISAKKINLDTMYNDGFSNFHQDLLQVLNQQNSKGIVFLYGEPGTGKTNYIRYLCGQVKKKVIYVPNEIVHQLSQPSFLSFLTENKNSIIILEDAENIFFDRNKIRSNTASSLLNLTDGILSDALQIQFICTFNTNIENIDHAFLRGGRTIGIHEFKLLEVDKCNKLFKDLESERRTEISISLSEIFNQQKIKTKKMKIGFQ